MAQISIYGLPSRLHRFRPAGQKLGREIDAIMNNYIYCSSFSSMNDPMEGTHTPGLSYVTAGRFRSDSSEINQHQADAGIASFTEVYDYETMWAHYADQFKGFCIAYKTQSLLKGLDDNLNLTRMNYNDRPPVLVDDNSTSWDKAMLTLSTKSVRWLHEREWRLFSKRSGPSHYKSEDTISRVYLGCRIDSNDERQIRNALSNRNISIVKMTLKNYQISFTGAVK